MHTIAVYGSLKRGHYNHPALEGHSTFLGEDKIKGTLYSLGAYPAITEEGDNLYDVEIYEVDEEAYQSIRGMELGAGYKEVTLELSGHQCIVYYADTRLAEYCKDKARQIDKY